MSDSSIEKAFAKLSVEFRAGMGEMRAGMADMATAVHQTNAKIDQTNILLAQTVTELVQTKTQLSKIEMTVNKKLDGIGSYLKSIDGTFGRHEQRISDLESRG